MGYLGRRGRDMPADGRHIGAELASVEQVGRSDSLDTVKGLA